MIDEQINVAMRTRESMMSQKNALKAIQTQITTLASEYFSHLKGLQTLMLTLDRSFSYDK